MRNLLILFTLLSSFLTIAQGNLLKFGVKAGVNYGDNGKIELVDITNAGENILSEDANQRTGYHFGAYLRASILNTLYIKPELLYTVNKSSYDVNGTEVDYEVKKIDLPILAGVSLIGPLHIFGGPSLQYIVDNELKNVKLGDIRNDFTVGMQFGIGVKIKRLNADIRYERGLSKNQAESIENELGTPLRVDSRPNQFILSVGVDF